MDTALTHWSSASAPERPAGGLRGFAGGAGVAKALTHFRLGGLFVDFASGGVAALGAATSGVAAGVLPGLARSPSREALERSGIVRLAAGASAPAAGGAAFTPDLRCFSRIFAMEKRFLSAPGGRPGPVFVIIDHYPFVTP